MQNLTVLHSFISRTQKVQGAIGRAQELGDGEAEGVGGFFAVNEVRRRLGNPSACGEALKRLMRWTGSASVAEVDVQGRPTGT